IHPSIPSIHPSIHPLEVLQEQEGSAGRPASWYEPHSLSFQVSLSAVLMVELVLGFSSNLTVLVLYCSQSNLVDSVSNMVTVSCMCWMWWCVCCANLVTMCRFHEACVTFASIATAINILVISLDRYDISVRPANRLLTTRRAALLLAAVWIVSVAVFFIPFSEMQWINEEPLDMSAWDNRTSLCGGGPYHSGRGMYYHLLLQVPIFFTTVAVMLFTYSRILRALNIRIGSHMKNQLSSTTPLVGSAKAAATPVAPTMGVHASVSAIIALRRAVRRHRDRRERQRRVFKMSLIIITTFLCCWAPLSVTNVLILGMGPSDILIDLRLWFLALAYGTTVSHPLLYAFTRQKLRRALRSKVKKRVVSLLQVDPSPGGAVLHNSWVENRKTSRQVRLEASEGTDRCLAEAL
uniref:G-protein coupled receptors family 1 profile domain-containing protein n=1 Tax=Neogobius melanostomus TaxID=47308 RepID=A0A8C6UF83_9GOBI